MEYTQAEGKIFPTSVSANSDDYGDNYYYGKRMALSGDGSVAVVLADPNVGVRNIYAHVYDVSEAGAWTLRHVFVLGPYSDSFQPEISLDGDGDTLLVAYIPTGTVSNNGYIEIHSWDESDWTRTLLIESESFYGPLRSGYACMNYNGDAFSYSHPWGEYGFSSYALWLRVHFLSDDGTNWDDETHINISFDTVGCFLNASGSRLAVLYEAQIHIYQWGGSGYTNLVKIYTVPIPSTSTYQGVLTANSDLSIFAYEVYDNIEGQFAVFLYYLNTSTDAFELLGKIYKDPAAVFDSFSTSSAITSDATSVYIGHSGHDSDTYTNLGCMYLFTGEGGEVLPPSGLPPIGRHVSGTVKEGDDFVSRVVAVYDRDTLELVGSAISDETSGEWSVNNIPSSVTEVFAVCLDDDAGTEYDALIEDRITPEEE